MRPRRFFALRLQAGFVLFLSGLLSTSAVAQNLDLEEVGAALALPILTDLDSDGWTLNTVTNVSPNPYLLHINMVSADPNPVTGLPWPASNFECYVTAAETVLFTFKPVLDGGFPSLEVVYECTNDQTGNEEPISTIYRGFVEGIFFVTLEDPASGDTVNVDAIFGDAVVIRYEPGLAWSAGAVSFQGGQAGVPGSEDTNYRFDGIEYSQWPSFLFSNFITSTQGIGSGVDAFLVLFTLDGTAGAEPDVSLDVVACNDDERCPSADHAFSCFDVVEITQIAPNYSRNDLGSVAGYISLQPQTTTQSNPNHDFLFDGPPGGGPADGQRNTPIHGWLFQVVHDQARVSPGPGGGPIMGTAAWARPLNQSTAPILPASMDDVPTFSGN